MAFTPIHHTSYPFISPSNFTNSLTNKTVLVTGASKGLGRAIALAFAAAGASVVGVARTSSELDTLISEIKQKSPDIEAIGIVADLLIESPQSIFQRASKSLGGKAIDILVNNAGTMRSHPFASEESISKWWAIQELNVRVPLGLVLAFLGQEGPESKTILTISSATASGGIPNFSAYAASKASLQKTMETLSLETPYEKLKNFILHPGFVDTGGLEREGVVETDDMRGFLGELLKYAGDDVGLSADTVVALAVLAGRENTGVEVLSGRFFNANWDYMGLREANAMVLGLVEEVLMQGERIRKEDLLRLRQAGAEFTS